MECTTVNMIFQIIGAIGSLATFGAFVFLFRRDKDKQTQILSQLKDLALLSQGLLKGEALNNFVQRSIGIIK